LISAARAQAAASGRHKSITGKQQITNQQQVAAIVDRWDRQMDRRTDRHLTVT